MQVLKFFAALLAGTPASARTLRSMLYGANALIHAISGNRCVLHIATVESRSLYILLAFLSGLRTGNVRLLKVYAIIVPMVIKGSIRLHYIVLTFSF